MRRGGEDSCGSVAGGLGSIVCLRIRGSRDEVSRVAMEEYDLFYQRI